jgi:hypothetical protein
MLSFYTSNKAIEREIDFVGKASTLLSLISTSSACLAYVEKNEIEIPISSVAHKTLDVKKIEEFSKKYSEIEPLCARDYENGYEIVIRMFGSELDTKKNYFSLQEKTWRFGSANFSYGSALKNVIEVSMPVSIRLNSSYQQPGEMKIKLVSGELEEFSGIINKVCDTGISARKKLSFSYVTYVDQDNVCQSAEKNVVCRKIACHSKAQRFEPGSYEIVLKKEGGIIEIA